MPEYKARKQAITLGARAAFIQVAILVLSVLFPWLAEITGASEAGAAELIFSSLLYAVMGYALLHQSRVAGVLLVASQLADVILILPDLYLALVPTVFLLAYMNAARATFVLHRIRRKEDPDKYKKPTPFWLKFTLSMIGCAVILFSTMAVLEEFWIIPSVDAQTGSELPDRVRTFMVDHEMIESDEEILLFYSEAFFSFTKDGNVLTDRRVISYAEIDGELRILGSLEYQEIEGVEVLNPGDFLGTAVIAVFDENGDSYELWVPQEDLQRFLDTLVENANITIGATVSSWQIFWVDSSTGEEAEAGASGPMIARYALRISTDGWAS